jgi:pimeloyl-ACP methyl ester carboxylesterase
MLVLFALVYAGISLVTAERLTRPTNHALTIDPHELSPDARSWSTRTVDGITLRGWHLPTESRRHLIVLVHGMWSSWVEMASLGRDLNRRGFDVLLFDLRGHGQSDPSRLYLGRRERADIRAVMSWAQGEGFTHDRIGWLGYSMGGSTLLMEAARNPQIQVAVIDSPYGDLPRLLSKQLSKHSGLPTWFNPGILLAARLIFGVRTDDLIPIRSARAWGERPLLLIHGESDSIVPVSQAYDLARTLGGSCLTLTLPGVDHVQAYQSNPEGYVQTVGAFFDDHLSP